MIIIFWLSLVTTLTLLAQENVFSKPYINSVSETYFTQNPVDFIYPIPDESGVLEKTTYQLTITHSGNAVGTTFPPPGVYQYPSGQSVGISIATSEGVYFGGWSGDASGSSEFIQVVMDRDKYIDARFTSTGHILNIYIVGEGGTTPGPIGNPHRYSSDVYVGITTYQTHPLWRFDRWEGDIGENDPRSHMLFNLLMDQDRNITAVFIPKPYYDLTIEIIGEGNVSLQKGFDAPIILPPGLHTYTYLEWTYIRCERIETTQGWKFLRWEGDFGDTLPTYPRCSFSMDKNRYIRCLFTNKTHVPNVVGIKQSEANTTITNAWLIVGDITEVCDDEYPAGYVIDQSPPAGTTVEIGSAVSLVLSTGPCPVTVPNVVGMTTEEVQIALTSARLLLGSVTEQCHNEIESGRVISQNPMGGAIVSPGSRVDIIVSSGPCPVAVPNIIWKVRSEAETMIINAGLAIGVVTEQCDDSVPANRVINQYPQPGIQVPLGTIVNFTVSSGPCVLTVPNVVSYSQTLAQRIITSAGLVVGEITEQCHPNIRKGIVISQSPVAGQQVPPNSPVNFVLSSGPCNEGTPEGTTEGEGTPDGIPEGTIEGEGIIEGSAEGTIEGTPEGIIEGEGINEGTPDGEGYTEGSEEGEKPPHSADPNGDWVISLTELLRVIQFFNSSGYHCEAGTEDGYAPGYDGDKNCTPHASDYNVQDWVINLSELLRIIQFFNSRGYHSCFDGEDGYCPGLKESFH